MQLYQQFSINNLSRIFEITKQENSEFKDKHQDNPNTF